MAIRGEVLSHDLSNVFQMLAMNRKRGGLSVRERGHPLNRRRLYVHEDGVSLQENPAVLPLAGVLVEMGVISPIQYREAVVASGQDPAQVLRVLTGRRVIDAEDVERVQDHLARERILDVFSWKNTSFELDEAASAPSPDVSCFGIDHLIMEAACRQDEASQFKEMVDVRRQIYTQTSRCDQRRALDLSPVQQVVLGEVDGMRASSGIMASTGMSRYHVELALSGLHAEGYIEPQGFSSLVKKGDLLVAEGCVADGARMLRAALWLDDSSASLHERVADAYLATGAIGKAATHFQHCAARLLALGRRRDAMAMHRRILVFLPTDFGALERYIALMALEGGSEAGDEEMLGRARSLLHYYLDTNQDHLAVGMAGRLHGILPADEELVQILGRLHLSMGNADKAVDLYVGQAGCQESSGQWGAALETYRVLCGIDPRRSALFESRIANLQRIRDGESTRRKKRKCLRVAAGVVVLLSAAYAAWSWRAAGAVAAIADPGRDDVSALQAAAFDLEEIAGRFPFTLPGNEASWRALSIRSRLQEVFEERRLVGVESSVRQERAVATAEDLLATGVRLMRNPEGNLDDALRAFRKAGAVVRSADASWDRWREVETQVASLQEYLLIGGQHLHAGEAALKSGDVATAFVELSTVATEYYRHPGVPEGGMTVPMRVEAAPADAIIEVDLPGSAESGQGALNFRIPHGPKRRLSTLRVRRDGYHTFEVAIDPQKSGWCIGVVLDREMAHTEDLGEPVANLSGMEDGRVVVLARNGKIGIFDPSRRRPVVTWAAATTLHTLRVPPAVSGIGVLVATEHGLFRLLDPLSLHSRWSRSLDDLPRADEVLQPVPVDGDFMAVSWTRGKGACISRLKHQCGSSLWASSLPGRPLSMAVSGGLVAVLLEGGQLQVRDADDGSPVGTFPTAFGSHLGGGRPGRFLVYRDGKGIVEIDPRTGHRELGINAPGGISCPPVETISGVAVGGMRGGLVMGRWGDTVEVHTDRPVTALAVGPLNSCVAHVGSRLFVLDMERRRVEYALRTDGTDAAPVAVTRDYVVVSLGDGVVGTVPLR